MSREERLIQIGNKNILNLFWVILGALIIISILSDEVTKMLIVTCCCIVLNLVIFFLNKNGRFLKEIMYIETVLIMGLALIFNLVRPHVLAYSIIFFAVVIITLFLNHRPLILATIIGFGELVYFFYANQIMNLTGMHDIFLYYYLFVMALYGVILTSVLRQTERLRLESETNKETIAQEKQQMQLVIEKMKENNIKLKTFSNQLNLNLDETKASSQQINASIYEISNSFDTQNESLLEITSNITNIDKSTQSASETSSEIVSFTQETSKKTDESKVEMNELDTKMNKIEIIVNDTVSMIGLLDHKMSEIMGIIDVLDGISSQTNLLALNASIEAARVGEAGRGFMVVADEVKKLAERSTVSTKDISAILNELRNYITSAVNKTQEGELAIVEGKRSVSLVKVSLDDINNNVKRVSSSFEKLDDLINTLKSTTTGIVKQTSNITAISEENMTSFNEIKYVMEEQTKQIEKISRDFKELDDSYMN